jgi:glycine betaine/proline transport system permease protein
MAPGFSTDWRNGWNALIDGILWVLQSPHPLIIVAVFVGLTWYLQRSWKICLLVFLGFLFIINQDYWEEMTESLTLVLSSCLVCMAIGVPIGIAAAHRPRLYQFLQPLLDLMQTLPTSSTSSRRSSSSASAWCRAFSQP